MSRPVSGTAHCATPCHGLAPHARAARAARAARPRPPASSCMRKHSYRTRLASPLPCSAAGKLRRHHRRRVLAAAPSSRRLSIPVRLVWGSGNGLTSIQFVCRFCAVFAFWSPSFSGTEKAEKRKKTGFWKPEHCACRVGVFGRDQHARRAPFFRGKSGFRGRRRERGP